MARMSRAPQLALLLPLAAVIAACGTAKLGTAGAPSLRSARALGGEVPATLDPALALGHVAYLTEPTLAGRGTATEGDRLADDYLENEFKKLGLATTRQAFTSGAFSGTAHNVIAMLPGTERSDRYVVVGAHKDHLGKRGGKIYFGANDNAGGTAAVLEIARVMVDRTTSAGDRPRSNIVFIAFSGEELGLIGSAFYCKNPIAPSRDGTTYPVPLKKIAGMVNLDCIAVGKTNALGTDAVDGRTQDELTAIAAKRGMKTVFKPFDSACGPHADGHAHEGGANRPLPPGASSDHASFRRAGVRSVCYYAEPVFSKFLHTPDDTIPSRDTVAKKPEDRFNVDNLVRIAGVAMDTVYKWSNEAESGGR